ncbi:TIGR03749 family integrating conjugative element protein [Methyloterricola oryzae]|uniref:TIGR03749 family integrating conjugative element protein n=1 Tax=Methyloterricola oryzae TaxID=1495050 RepID=UPI000699E36A|nr:TIGR03749 family integrating conjugative element protein [Methyloterricola oryzae]
MKTVLLLLALAARYAAAEEGTSVEFMQGAAELDGLGLPPPPQDGSPLLLPTANSPGERLVWNRVPLAVTLPVGRERLVSFPVAVRTGLPGDLRSSLLRTQIVDGTIYWRAEQPFAAHRVQVQALGSGNTYLLDLSASEQSETSPIEVVIPEHRPERGAAGNNRPSSATTESYEGRRNPQHDYVSLMRMAAQQMYAPRRLLRMPDGVHGAGVSHASAGDLIRGSPTEVLPLAAWRSSGLHVTAVKLRNKGREALILDPRTLRGRWLACTFQHAKLFPRGDERDTTAVYLISDLPFQEALHGRQ